MRVHVRKRGGLYKTTVAWAWYSWVRDQGNYFCTNTSQTETNKTRVLCQCISYSVSQKLNKRIAEEAIKIAQNNFTQAAFVSFYLYSQMPYFHEFQARTEGDRNTTANDL